MPIDIRIDHLPPALVPSRAAVLASMLDGLAEKLSVDQIFSLIAASDVPMGEAVFVADHAFTAPDSRKMSVFNKATAVSGTLPALAGTANEVYFARNIGVGDLTIDPNGAETIEGAATLVLATGTTAMIWPDATKAAWRAVRIARSELDRVSVKGANIASAATVDLSAATGDDVTITGVASISGFGTAPSGVRRHLTFAGAATVVYNAVSMILPGRANILAAAGDTADVVSLGSGNWRMTQFQRAGFVAPRVGTPKRLVLDRFSDIATTAVDADVLLIETLCYAIDGDNYGRTYKRVVSQPPLPVPVRALSLDGAHWESTAPRWFLAASAQSNGASAAFVWSPPPYLFLRNNEQTAFSAASGAVQSAWASFAAQKALERPDMDVFAAAAAVGGLDIAHWNNGLKNFKFDTDPTESDPGNGFLRVNNANPALATELYCSAFSSTGVRKIGQLGTASAGQTIIFEKVNDPTSFVRYTVVSHTFSPPGGGFYYNAQVTYHSSGGTIADNDNIRIRITPDMYVTYLSPMLIDAIAELGKQPDHMWWWQIESDVDGGFGLGEYIVDHDSVRARMIADGLITAQTQWTIMGIAPESIYAATGHDEANGVLMKLAASRPELYTYVHTGVIEAALWDSPAIHLTGAGFHAAGKLAYNATFNGGRTRTRAPKFTSGPVQFENISIADDGVFSFPMPPTAWGFGVLTLSVDGWSKGFHWRTSATTPTMSQMFAGASGASITLATSTGVYTGTSGADGSLTVALSTVGRLYIENRIGAAISVSLFIFGTP